MTSLRIGASLWAAGVRGALEYRMNFVLEMLMSLVGEGVGFALMWVILARFETIAGWTLGEVAFLFGLRVTMLALCGLATGSIWRVQTFVRLGEFDLILVRPIHPLLQILTRDVPMAALGDLVGGVALIAAANGPVDVAWTPLAILYLLLALAGGALIQLAMRLLVVAFSFRVLNVNALLGIVGDLFNDVGTYPLAIFNTTLQFLLTFGIPVAFMAYFPAAVLFGRTSELQAHPLFAYGAPLAGMLWMGIALWVFKREMRNYQSSGH